MTVTGTLTLAEAQRVGEAVVRLLRPICHRVEIAGSVRRCKPQVHDIEVLAIPRPSPKATIQAKLIGTVEVDRWTTDDWADEGLRSGLLEHRRDKAGRPACGVRFKRLKIDSEKVVPGIRAGWMALDLFVVLPPAQWGCLMAIRTGPADYSHNLATTALQRGMRIHDGHLEVGKGEGEWTVLATPEEADLFRELGLPHPLPEDRV